MKKHLIKYLKETNLITIAVDNFWKSFNNYKTEEEDEYLKIFNHREVTPTLDNISYKMFVNSINVDVIILKYDIYCGEELVGDYRYVVNFLTNEPIDDYLVFR